MARTLDKKSYEMVERVLAQSDNGCYTIDDLLRLPAPLGPYLKEWYQTGLKKAQQAPSRMHTSNGVTWMDRTPTKTLVTRRLWKDSIRRHEAAKTARYSLSARQKQRLRELQLFCLRVALHLKMWDAPQMADTLLQEGVITKPQLLLMQLTRAIRPV